MEINTIVQNIKTYMCTKLKREMTGIHIINGNIAVNMPKPPNLHVILGKATCDMSHTANRQFWTLPINFVGIVTQNKDIQEANQKVLDMVSQAIDMFLYDDLDMDDVIYDVEPISLDFEATEAETKIGMVSTAQSSVVVKFWVL